MSSLIVLEGGTRLIVGDSPEGVGLSMELAIDAGEEFTALESGTILQVAKVLAVVAIQDRKEDQGGGWFSSFVRPLDN